MSKRLGGIKGCKYKTSSWHSNRFPDAGNIVVVAPLGSMYCTMYCFAFLFSSLCPCIAISVNINYNSGILPDIVLLTLC